ncbi:MAG: IS66 family insertion sequence element accessory protein TnpB, partial [Thiohalocapsa sp.]
CARRAGTLHGGGLMLQLTPQSRVFVAIEPADFRRGIDGLAALCRQRLREDPFTGAIFVFRNRRSTTLKLLCYDGQGFWLCQKRFSQGRLNWWPGSAQASHRLSARALQILLWNGNPEDAGLADDWREVA